MCEFYPYLGVITDRLSNTLSVLKTLTNFGGIIGKGLELINY